jgi:membrane-associated phospholipid phosphatase
VILNHRRALALAIGLLAGAILLGVLVAVPGTRHGVQVVDDAARRLAVRMQNRPSTLIAEGLSLLGGIWINWSIRILALAVLAFRRQFVQFAAFALAVVTSEILIGTLKAAYDRPRPPGALIATSGASFPSGHAIAASVTAVGLVLVILPPGPARWKWEARAVAFAFVMALSRVYLRAHWLSDVVAGALLGGALALGWPALLQTLRARRTSPPTGSDQEETWQDA